MQYAVKNISKPMLSAPTDPVFEVGKTALTMVQKGIVDTKMKKYIDREEMLEENLKRAFIILRGQCTERFFSNLGGNRKYEAIENDQYIIGMLKIIKEVIFKFNLNKELTHAIWESYVSFFRFRQHKFENNQEYFERFNNATSVINKYYRSIRQDARLVNHLGSK